MSKSIGNVVTPEGNSHTYGRRRPALKTIFLRHILPYEDGDFSWDRFEGGLPYNELANEPR